MTDQGIRDARSLGVPKMALLGFQHMFAMFGATVLVPVLTGLPVAATLPHIRQPTRLPHPWDSPGKNTGVGCHFLLRYMKVKVKLLSHA